MDYRKKLILVLSMFVAIGMQAQNISLKSGDSSIREVIETLQNDYGYSFSIRTSEVNVEKPVNIDVANADIKAVLDKIFAGSKVSYSIDGKLISVTEAAPQKPKKNATVTGQVLDEIGPVIGASVMVKGTKIGVITDFDGKFSLDCGMPAPVTIEIGFL